MAAFATTLPPGEGKTSVHAVIVWWDLSASDQTIESMRTYLREESVAAFSEVPGLRLKMWLSDTETNRWGAVLLFETVEASQQPLPSRALELIGRPTAVAHSFDVEATVEGRYETQQLARRGRAFDGTGETSTAGTPTAVAGPAPSSPRRRVV
jgi:hypothetical protein